MGEDWDREIDFVQSTIKYLPLVDQNKEMSVPHLVSISANSS